MNQTFAKILVGLLVGTSTVTTGAAIAKIVRQNSSAVASVNPLADTEWNVAPAGSGNAPAPADNGAAAPAPSSEPATAITPTTTPATSSQVQPPAPAPAVSTTTHSINRVSGEDDGGWDD